MEIKPFSESEMSKDLDGHTVRDYSSSEYRIRNQKIAVEERRPLRGYLRNGPGILMVQVLNRHGLLLMNTPEGEKARPIHNDDTMYIEPHADYAVKGSLDIREIELPALHQNADEHAEYVEE